MRYAVRLLVVIALVVLLSSGCDHSTNSQEPPASSEFAITAPRHDSLVEGTVTIATNAASISPVRIEFYVDGELVASCTSYPWQATWNTAGLPSNSHHTLKARAYSSSSSYKTTDEVVVRVK
jgi:hypothetical protein